MDSPLDGILERAGAVMVVRRTRRVAAHFGSVAAELAVCRATVGLADCSEVGKLELRGDPRAVSLVADARIDVGRWCPITPHRRLLVGATPAETERVVALARQLEGASTIDLSDDYAAIAVVGPRGGALLWRLGFFAGFAGGPYAAGTFETGWLGRVPAMVVVQHPLGALVLVARSHAPCAWRVLRDAGLPDRVACVGRDALDLFARTGDRPTAPVA